MYPALSLDRKRQFVIAGVKTGHTSSLRKFISFNAIEKIRQ